MLLFGAGNILHAQSGSDCLQWLRKVYRTMEQQYKPSAGKALYLNYEVSTLMNDGPFTMTAELYSNEQKSWFISKEAEVYQDNSTTVSILPSGKTIFISDFTGKEEKEAKIKQLSFIQDTLFQLCKVSFCGKGEAGDGKEYKKITLKLSEEGRKLFKAEWMDFYVDERKEQLKEVYVKHIPGHPVKEMNVRFNKMEITAPPEKLNGSLLAQVLDENGRIKPMYKNYKLTDNRSKKIN